jgi:alpha-N-arabinofuranosidase
MNATLRLGEPAHLAPATLLGQNIEVAADTVPGLLTERLTNGHFRGPVDPRTGIADGWVPAWGFNGPARHYAVVEGMYLSGTQSQLIGAAEGRGAGICQIGRKVRAGETLRVEIWARTQHTPLPLQVTLRPWQSGRPVYADATVTIDKVYWDRYTVTLTVPADDDDAVFGLFLPDDGHLFIDSVSLRPAEEPRVRRDLLDRFAAMRIPVLRFPGGCVSTAYHWQRGTGPAHLRAPELDPVFKWDVDYAFGTDEYLELCLAQGIMPQFTVNITSATPDDAAAWAAYAADWFRARGVTPPPAYWQIGNEHYGAWEHGHMTGAMYAALLHAFVPPIRAAYPGARIVALGPDTAQGDTAAESQPWRAPVLAGAGDLIDVLAIQYYCGLADTPRPDMPALIRGMAGLADTLAATTRDAQACRPALRTGITEWNLWRSAGHHDGKGFLEVCDVTHGLFVASVLHALVRQPHLELANFYHLVNPMGLFLSHAPDLVETPTVEVFRLYRPAFPGRARPVAVESPLLGPDAPALDAACLEADGATHLFLVNRSLDDALHVTLPAPAAGLTLAGTAPDGHWEGREVGGAALALPPMSITRVSW